MLKYMFLFISILYLSACQSKSEKEIVLTFFDKFYKENILEAFKEYKKNDCKVYHRQHPEELSKWLNSFKVMKCTSLYEYKIINEVSELNGNRKVYKILLSNKTKNRRDTLAIAIEKEGQNYLVRLFADTFRNMIKNENGIKKQLLRTYFSGNPNKGGKTDNLLNVIDKWFEDIITIPDSEVYLLYAKYQAYILNNDIAYNYAITGTKMKYIKDNTYNDMFFQKFKEGDVHALSIYKRDEVNRIAVASQDTDNMHLEDHYQVIQDHKDFSKTKNPLVDYMYAQWMEYRFAGENIDYLAPIHFIDGEPLRNLNKTLVMYQECGKKYREYREECSKSIKRIQAKIEMLKNKKTH